MSEFPYPPSWDRAGLESVGFRGFVTFDDVRIPRHLELPKTHGIYAVVRPGSTKRAFTSTSLAEGKPYEVETLVGRWVEDSPILYIGKADPAKGGIHSRVKQYARRGSSHTGGRAIWQLADANELLVGWAPTDEELGRTVEQRWIARFEETFGRKPFANVAS